MEEIKYGQLWARHSELVYPNVVGTYRITFEGLKKAVEEAMQIRQLQPGLSREANNRDMEGTAEVSQDAHEKEVMMQAFSKVRQIFEGRQWITEGRGSYPYNDDRYKEEVRYMYDEFDAIQKDTWENIESKSFEYRKAIVEAYVKGTAAGREEDAVSFAEWLLYEVIGTDENTNDNKPLWIFRDGKRYTTAQLYELFKSQKK